MPERQQEVQVPLLLRVGLGAVWVYEGLVPNLLAPTAETLALIARVQPFPGDPVAFLRAVGVFKILLGLLLLRGWMVRSVAALQCGFLLLFAVGIGVAAPRYLVHPTGAISKSVALGAAGLCLLLLGSGTEPPLRPSWLDRAVPLILRLGLGVMWLYEGILPKWLFPSPAEIEIIARTGLVPVHIPIFLKCLGIAEATLGLTILAGLSIRGLAVLQAGLISAFTAIIGWTSPTYLTDILGTLSKNLGLMGSALALYHTGGGSWALDAWLWRNTIWRGWLLLANLQWNHATEIGIAEIYRVQSGAASDPNVRGLLEKFGLDEANHAEDLASLIRRHGGRQLPLSILSRGASWILGCISVILGTRAVLRFDLWLEERELSLYARCANLLPLEAGITARALQAMQNQETQHIRLLRDHLRAVRGTARRRR